MATPHIAALLREREHYLRRGLPDKAAAVTAELERLGHVEPSRDDLVGRAHDDAPETTALEALPERAVPPRPRPKKEQP